MKTWIFLAAFLISFLFVHCSATHSNHSKSITPSQPIGLKKKPVERKTGIREVVQVGCTDQITITRGQVLTLKLPITAGTGYMWLLHRPIAHLKLKDEKVLKIEKTESGKVGFSQYQVLTLDALESGEENVDLIYIRPTDPENVGNKCLMRVIIQE